MMKGYFLFFCMVLCWSGSSVFSQEDAVARIIHMGQTDNRVMDHLDVLTNRFGGRLVGSGAYEDAKEWMVREFEKWGLDVKCEEAGSVPVGFNRGPWFGRMLGEEGMVLHFATPSYTSGTKGLQHGHVLIEPRTQAEFNRMKEVLKGSWVLISGDNDGFPIIRSTNADEARARIISENNEIEVENRDRMRRNRSNSEKSELLLYKEFPALFYREMCDAGVLGFIQSSGVPIRALYDRVMLNDPETCFDNLPEKPDIKLDAHQFATIKQMVEERRDFLLEFDIRNHFRIGPIKYHNVVGSIKGSEFPDEYVIVSGHLDAFDVATGGVDCGTGIGPMMEAARMIALSGAKPKRTILFVAFAAEEFGLLGAKSFAAKHADLLPNIANVFNRDGGPLPPVGITVPAAMYDDFVRICEPIKGIRPDYPFEVKKREGITPRPVTPTNHDGSVFAVEGVPIVNFTTEDIKGYNFVYDEIWHTERDLYTKNIPEYQEYTATCIAITVLGIANLDHQLSREGAYE